MVSPNTIGTPELSFSDAVTDIGDFDSIVISAVHKSSNPLSELSVCSHARKPTQFGLEKREQISMNQAIATRGFLMFPLKVLVKFAHQSVSIPATLRLFITTKNAELTKHAMKAAHIGIAAAACSVFILVFLSATWTDSSKTSELLVLGPLGPNFGFVLGLSGADAVLAQLHYDHLNHKRIHHHVASAVAQLSGRKADAQERANLRWRQGRLQELSSDSEAASDLDADDPKFSNRIWKHQEPENNTFADLEVVLYYLDEAQKTCQLTDYFRIEDMYGTVQGKKKTYSKTMVPISQMIPAQKR